MPFGFGGSKQRSSSSSSSSSSSFDNLDQFGVNIGSSTSAQGSQSASTQSVAFQDIFAQMFGGATGAAAGINTGATTDAANLLFGSGNRFLDTLSTGGAGAGFLEDRLAMSDDLVNAQVGLLEQDIGRFLSETVNPAITERGVQAGTLGGGRGEVQRGIASRGAVEEFARGSVDIRARERAATDQIAQALSADETARATQGIAGLSPVLELLRTGNLASLEPFSILSQIVGPVTALTESSATSFGGSESFDFGFDTTTGRAGSRSSSQSSSSSSGKSFNFGFGK